MTTPAPARTQFERELESLLNRTSQENASNTPDFILAQYLSDCLAAFNTATVARSAWYGHVESDSPRAEAA